MLYCGSKKIATKGFMYNNDTRVHKIENATHEFNATKFWSLNNNKPQL